MSKHGTILYFKGRLPTLLYTLHWGEATLSHVIVNSSARKKNKQKVEYCGIKTSWMQQYFFFSFPLCCFITVFGVRTAAKRRWDINTWVWTCYSCDLSISLKHNILFVCLSSSRSLCLSLRHTHSQTHTHFLWLFSFFYSKQLLNTAQAPICMLQQIYGPIRKQGRD